MLSGSMWLGWLRLGSCSWGPCCCKKEEDMETASPPSVTRARPRAPPFLRAVLGWRAAGARVCQPQEGEMGLSHMDQLEHRCSFAREEVQEAVGVSRKEDDKMGLAGCLSLAVKGPRESGREVGISSCRWGASWLQPDSTHTFFLHSLWATNDVYIFILFILLNFLAAPQGTWDLSSPTREPVSPAVEAWEILHF